MKMLISDIADKYTILLLKNERLGTEYELDSYLENIPPEIDSYIHDLYHVNGLIWDLESDIRKCKDDQLGFEEIGRRAVEIRNLNSKRIDIKNKIAREFGEIEDVKGNHISQKI